jgi:hypothetical protein
MQVAIGLALAAAILAAMIVISCYGWVTLPSDARVPIHFGVTYNNFVPKPIGLILHPAAGAVAFIILIVVAHGHVATHGHGPAPYIILPIIMVVMLVVQIGAIRVARQRFGH